MLLELAVAAVPSSCGNVWAWLGVGTRQLLAELASGFASPPTASFLLGRFLDEVQSHSNVNKMSVQNLATVFGPNILRPQMEDPVTIMEGNGACMACWAPLGWAHLDPGQVVRTIVPGQQEGWLHPWGLPHRLLQLPLPQRVQL